MRMRWKRSAMLIVPVNQVEASWVLGSTRTSNSLNRMRPGSAVVRSPSKRIQLSRRAGERVIDQVDAAWPFTSVKSV